MVDSKLTYLKGLSTCRLTALLIFSGCSSCIYGILVSLQPPFYPAEAEKKGATPSQYGLVFGILHLSGCIFAPIFGRYGARIGPKRLCVTGTYIQGSVGFAFGFLTHFDDLVTFLSLSYILRILSGISEVAAYNTLVSILANIFPLHVSKVIAYLEMSYGLGYAMGPVVGSSLYIIGGFNLPFTLAGSVAITLATILPILIPSDCHQENNNVNENAVCLDERQQLTFLEMIRNPTIIIPFVDNCVTIAGQGIILSMMAPHLVEILGLDHTQTALVYGSWGVTYVIGAPLAGFISSYVKYPVTLSLFGNACLITSLSLAGPLPFLPIQPPGASYFMFVLGVAALGTNFMMNSVFNRAKRIAEQNGFPADINTLLFISGMWSSSYFFGAFAGATIAGILVEHFSFEVASIFFWVAVLATTTMDVWEFLRDLTDNNNSKKKQQANNSPIQISDNKVRQADITPKTYGSLQ